MAASPTKVVFDVSSGTSIVVPLTDEEIAQLAVDAANPLPLPTGPDEPQRIAGGMAKTIHDAVAGVTVTSADGIALKAAITGALQPFVPKAVGPKATVAPSKPAKAKRKTT